MPAVTFDGAVAERTSHVRYLGNVEKLETLPAGTKPRRREALKEEVLDDLP